MDIFSNLVPCKGPIKNWSFPNFGTDKGYINGITGFCIMLPRLLLIISGSFRKFPQTLNFRKVNNPIEDRGETDRVAVLPRPYTMDIDFWPWHYFQSQASCGHDLPPTTTHIHTHKPNSISNVSHFKREWKQINRQKDATSCFVFPANKVGNKPEHLIFVVTFCF